MRRFAGPAAACAAAAACTLALAAQASANIVVPASLSLPVTVPSMGNYSVGAATMALLAVAAARVGYAAGGSSEAVALPVVLCLLLLGALGAVYLAGRKHGAADQALGGRTVGRAFRNVP